MTQLTGIGICLQGYDALQPHTRAESGIAAFKPASSTAMKANPSGRLLMASTLPTLTAC